eukprot:6373909-Amphidinium_carterae.1
MSGSCNCIPTGQVSSLLVTNNSKDEQSKFVTGYTDQVPHSPSGGAVYPPRGKEKWYVASSSEVFASPARG